MSLTFIHDVLLQGIWVVGGSPIECTQQLTHTAHGYAEGLNEEQELRNFQLTQRCNTDVPTDSRSDGHFVFDVSSTR